MNFKREQNRQNDEHFPVITKCSTIFPNGTFEGTVAIFAVFLLVQLYFLSFRLNKYCRFCVFS